MSRLGRTPVQLPKGVELKREGNTLRVSGPKGTLSMPVAEGIQFEVADGMVNVIKQPEADLAKPVQGLFRSLLSNMIVGVTKGYEVKLSLVGVGYRASLQGQKVDLQLGFSHPVQVAVPKNVTVTIDKSVTITITGADKQIVGQFAATIRSKKPPEPYKGKGIRYENEIVRKKDGKAAKGKTA